MAATGALRAEVEPMTINGTIIGCLAVTWTQYGLAPSPEARSVLSLLAAHAAMLAERDELQRIAREDALTSLPNRRAFDDALRREIGRAARHGSPLAVALIDLDDLKRLNDTGGHQAGDEALRGAGEAWRGQLRDLDVLARIGGDEFGLVLPDCDLDRGREVAERLRLAMPGSLSCSIGLTRWAPGEEPGDVLHRADDALYESKRAGRNRSTALDAPSTDGDPAVAPR
jgi:diguanylate cyclase (GGDEF)-like protein